MDFLELAKNRYSCRKFTEERIGREELEKILEA
jgi:nitroreductase